MSRRILVPERGVLRIEQRIRTARPEVGTDVSGPACIYAHVEVARGRVAYLRGETQVIAPDRFALLLPPFAVVQAALDRCDVTSVAFAFLPPVEGVVPGEASLLAGTPRDPPRSMSDVLERLAISRPAVPISRGDDGSPLARHAKTILDSEYATPLTIGRICARLHASPARLSRAFKSMYGVPPVRYRHQVRVMDALLRFAAGAAPANVSLDVGFEDLSRFYKVFRKVACGPPASYRPGRSKNAKT